MAIVEKKVELIELFYDLIFVYAISKLTALISEPVNGTVAPDSFFIYHHIFCNLAGMAVFYKLRQQIWAMALA